MERPPTRSAAHSRIALVIHFEFVNGDRTIFIRPGHSMCGHRKMRPRPSVDTPLLHLFSNDTLALPFLRCNVATQCTSSYYKFLSTLGSIILFHSKVVVKKSLLAMRPQCLFICVCMYNNITLLMFLCVYK